MTNLKLLEKITGEPNLTRLKHESMKGLAMISLSFNDTIKYLVIFSMFYLGGCAGYSAALDTSTCTQRGGTVQDVCVHRDPYNLANCLRVESQCMGSMTHDEYNKQAKETRKQKYREEVYSSPNEALTNAAYDGDATKVKALLAKGANINNKDKYGGTALMNASLKGHEAVVKVLLARGAKLDLQSSDGWTALTMASKRGHEAIVKMLLAKGAAVNIKFHSGGTAIDVAKTEKIRQLLKAGGVSTPSSAQASSSDNEALLAAAWNGDAAKVKVLLRKGVNINHTDTHEITALMMASQKGHEAVVKILLAKGAKLELLSTLGWTALRMASATGQEAIVKMLLAKGAKIDTQDGMGGETALMFASRLGHEAVVKILLDKGADISLKDNFGKTALNKANTEKVWKLLKAAGAK